jgi:ubiquinone biosynthesis monooxygenase Coq7
MSKNDLHNIIRVDHAGELGAKWIYEGQLRWIKDPKVKAEIQHMYEQEQAHLDYFETMIRQRNVRPTALMPLWKWVGRTVGAASAVLGSKAAMACTEAVEDVIDHHYAEQIHQLETHHPEEIELINSLKTFREDECNHRDAAAEYDQAPNMVKSVIKQMIKVGVKTAIRISKRV